MSPKEKLMRRRVLLVVILCAGVPWPRREGRLDVAPWRWCSPSFCRPRRSWPGARPRTGLSSGTGTARLRSCGQRGRWAGPSASASSHGLRAAPGLRDEGPFLVQGSG